MHKLVESALKIAESQLGVRETGENVGREVNQYLRTAGCPPGNPWCAAFVYWCIQEACDDLEVATHPFVKTAGCAVIGSWASDRGLLRDRPEPGDVFLRHGVVKGVARFCHTGFVTSVNGNTYGTIEGNTNTGGSREGIGVFKRSRAVRSVDKFVRWERVAPEIASQSFTFVLSGNPRFELPVRDGRALCSIREWGQALGLEVGWDEAEGMPLLDGKSLDVEVIVLKGRAYAPIRELVDEAGLELRVDGPKKQILVSRPG